MRRFCVAIITLLALVAAPSVRADGFDHYTNPILSKAHEAQGAKELTKVTAEQIVESGGVIPNNTGTLLVVRTNDGRLSKLLVQSARKKLNDEAGTLVPIILVERYATYRPGTERAVEASGQNVILFDGFRLSLDMGQVVPDKLSADLRFVFKEGDKPEAYLEAMGKAKIYLMTKAMPEATPKKGKKFVMGEKFDIKYFAGKFKLYDDGRRSGVLNLKVSDDGEVTGTYTSDKDGQQYEVKGKVTTPKHAIEFVIQLPRVDQSFKGMLFTGDGLAIAGTSKMQDREAGFYATRVEEE